MGARLFFKPARRRELTSLTFTRAERNHQPYSIKRNLEWFEKYVKGGATSKSSSLP
jgi:hypothetical protein